MDIASSESQNKVLIAMSGGVDSSVAAHILLEQGYDCTGAMMKLYTDEIIELGTNYSVNFSTDGYFSAGNFDAVSNRGCCSLEDVEDARAVATALGIPFFVFNFSDSFAKEVMDRFVNAYSKGLTPNPCIDCNRFMKFERFLARATELEVEYIATGHYAKITRDANGRHLLARGIDTSKDQTYVLYAMTQPQLARTLFPLGSLTKDEVRDIAAKLDFTTATKRDSQDICFAPDKDYAGFITRYTGKVSKPGDFISQNGEILGQHKGIIHYTIGQRKGLGIYGAEPVYVSKINPAKNTVTVGPQGQLFAKSLTATDINFIPMDKLDTPLNIHAKIRYSHPGQPAKLWQTDTNEFHVEFTQPQRAITPGQAVVLYDGDIVIGGGTIVA